MKRSSEDGLALLVRVASGARCLPENEDFDSTVCRSERRVRFRQSDLDAHDARLRPVTVEEKVEEVVEEVVEAPDTTSFQRILQISTDRAIASTIISLSQTTTRLCQEHGAVTDKLHRATMALACARRYFQAYSMQPVPLNDQTVAQKLQTMSTLHQIIMLMQSNVAQLTGQQQYLRGLITHVRNVLQDTCSDTHVAL